MLIEVDCEKYTPTLPPSHLPIWMSLTDCLVPGSNRDTNGPPDVLPAVGLFSSSEKSLERQEWSPRWLKTMPMHGFTWGSSPYHGHPSCLMVAGGLEQYI